MSELSVSKFKTLSSPSLNVVAVAAPVLDVAPAAPGRIRGVAVALGGADGVDVGVVVALAVARLHRRRSLGKMETR